MKADIIMNSYRYASFATISLSIQGFTKWFDACLTNSTTETKKSLYIVFLQKIVIEFLSKKTLKIRVKAWPHGLYFSLCYCVIVQAGC